MKIYPAIDLRGGRVVRLLRGDYGQSQTYDVAPEDAARSFYAAGARFLHVVDLDGAKDGSLSNFDTVSRIIAAAPLYVEIGGGIRDMGRLERYLDAGAGRVILGTAAVRDPAFLDEAVRLYPDRIAVGIDARDGMVATDGWLNVSSVRGDELCRTMRDRGVRAVIYTDIARDGAMEGTNLPLYERLVQLEGLEITASGGICREEEITALRRMGVHAAIIGKALYSGALELSRVLALAGEQEETV